MSVNNKQQELNANKDAGQFPVSSEDDLAVLDDLFLTAATEADIKAGRHCLGCNWGPPVTNHNETTTADDADEWELDDLITVADDAQVKGGGFYVGGWGASSYQSSVGIDGNIAGQCNPSGPRSPGGTGFVNNHNETTVSDEEGEANLADLEPAREEMDEIKGGGVCHGVTVLAWARGN